MLFAILDTTQVVISVTSSDTDLSDATHVKLPDMTAVEAVMGKTWDGQRFRDGPPPDPKSAKLAELSAACAAEIVGGYQSSALGAPHTYPCAIKDQVNMLGSVTASLLPGLPSGWTTPFWVADASGTWSFQAHTAAQIQQAGADGKTHVATCQTRLDDLSKQVMAATTAEDIAAVDWATASS